MNAGYWKASKIFWTFHCKIIGNMNKRKKLKKLLYAKRRRRKTKRKTEIIRIIKNNEKKIIKIHVRVHVQRCNIEASDREFQIFSVQMSVLMLRRAEDQSLVFSLNGALKISLVRSPTAIADEQFSLDFSGILPQKPSNRDRLELLSIWWSSVSLGL